MKNLNYFLVLVIMAITFGSCARISNVFTGEQEALRDSLLSNKLALENEINGYFEVMNEIEANLGEISQLEGYLKTRSLEGNNINQKDKINESISLISEILQKNDGQIKDLQSKLNASGLKLTGFQKTIARLNEAITLKESEIGELVKEIEKKDALIIEQEFKIKGLNEVVTEQIIEQEKDKKIISDQDAALFSAWYAFGTSKELKKERIITQNGVFASKQILQSDFNQDYFIKIDRREVTVIPLYAKKAKILTNHPQNSYQLKKIEGKFSLYIDDADEFWSISKYLVIQID